MNLILYGPPASGKTTIGRLVAERLGREFIDGDAWIETHWGRPIPDYFEKGEEPLFRARELETYRLLAARDNLVIAPGGGALREPHCRAALEATGVVICLTADLDTLVSRLNGGPVRPLLAGDARSRLAALLKEREALYRSFAWQVDTSSLTAEAAAAAVLEHFQEVAGLVRFEMGACSMLMGRGLLSRLPDFLRQKQVRPPLVIISDSNVAPLYGGVPGNALAAPRVSFPAGEAHKNLDTVRDLYAACVKHGLERGGAVLALGGGVVGDVAGFVAATFMRGVRWVNLPTTVLAMCDAALGGKTGVDLPQGKNLVGAFHFPVLVAADFDVLATLPEAERRCGLAEVVKSAIIGDVDLFVRLERDDIALEAAVARAAAVKVGIVNADPFEAGERAQLNLGHTVGHGLEAASGYAVRHGEAVAVGMVAEARLAEAIGLAEGGLAERIAACLQRLGLPAGPIGQNVDAIRRAMQADKKKAGGKIKFALPRRLGEVVHGVEVSDSLVTKVLTEMAG